MKGAAQLRGITDVRTSASRHTPTLPRRRDSVHLELYRLEKERQRLEAELSLLVRRAGRVTRRMDEIAGLAAGLAIPPGPAPARPAAGATARWRRMPVGY